MIALVLLFGAMGFLVAGLMRLHAERDALLSERNAVPTNRFPPVPVLVPQTPPREPIAPVAAPPVPISVPVVPADPLDNAPLLHLLEELTRFGGDLGSDAAHFAPPAREVSDHVLLKLAEIMERVPGVETIAPAPGDLLVRGEHKNIGAGSDAAPVARLLVPGVRVSGRVLRPALVETDL